MSRHNDPVSASFELPQNYLFYPAQFWPHKNHVTLLRAMQILRDSYSYDLDLLLSGSDQGNLAYVKSVAAELGLAERVHFLGFVSRRDLVALYSNADAMAYPAFCGYENFPPLEAFALGCPVIAAKISSEDQLGDAALLVQATDEHALAEAIQALRTQPDLRQTLIAKGRLRAAAFTGEDYARGIFAILDEFEKVRRCWSQEERHEIRFPWRRFFSG
jgi:glycosyltransferase involved in cell wall biosynthesis